MQYLHEKLEPSTYKKKRERERNIPGYDRADLRSSSFIQ